MWTPASPQFPIVGWLPKYTRDDFVSDLIAGMTVFILLIPQAMGYAVLAGMPAVYGLYSCTVPLFVYTVMGTSRHLSIGPMGVICLMLGMACQTLEPDTESHKYVVLVQNVSLIAGLVTLALGFFKLGSIVNLLSTSVLSGFLSASALLVAITNFRVMLGINVPHYPYMVQTVGYTLSHIDETNGYAIVMGLITWFILWLIRGWRQRNQKISEQDEAKSLISPITRKRLLVAANAASFMALIVGSLVAEAIIKGGGNVPVVGKVPSGMKVTVNPPMSFNEFIALFPTSIAVSLVAYVSNWAITTKYATMFDYKEAIDPTQELLATGISNLVGILFGGFFINGGLGRTVVNVDAGAKTQISSCIVAVMIILALLLLTSVLYYIPNAVLSAIILTSITAMIDIQVMINAYYQDIQACVVMVSTFMIALFVGITEGLFLGVGVSIVVTLYNDAYLHIATLGSLGSEKAHYVDILRHPTALQVPGIAIMRLDSKVSFLNSVAFRKYALKAVKGKYHSSSSEPIQTLIIDMSGCNSIDRDGINALTQLYEELKKDFKVKLKIAGPHGYTRGRLIDTGIMKKLGPENVFMSVADAINDVPFSTHSNEIDARMTELTLISTGQVSANPYHRTLSPFTSSFRDSTIGGDAPMIPSALRIETAAGGGGGVGGIAFDNIPASTSSSPDRSPCSSPARHGRNYNDDDNDDDETGIMGMQLMDKKRSEPLDDSSNTV